LCGFVWAGFWGCSHQIDEPIGLVLQVLGTDCFQTGPNKQQRSLEIAVARIFYFNNGAVNAFNHGTPSFWGFFPVIVEQKLAFNQGGGKSMEIILFGGSFDPIHNGHLAMMQTALDFLPHARLVLMPAACSPFKTHKTQTAEQHRLQMCRLATEKMNRVSVSDMEFFMEKPSYTIRTVEKLQNQQAGDYYFLCGADSFLSLDKWKEYERLIQKVTFLVINRGEGSLDRLEGQKAFVERLGGGAHILKMEKHPASSTLVREQIKAQKIDRQLLCSSVLRYIQENGLYKE
jgi:nicotinate-nucleotide adenylyltransferase